MIRSEALKAALQKIEDNDGNAHLDLSTSFNQSKLTSADMPALVRELQNHPEIISLDLAFNKIDKDGAADIAKLQNLLSLNLAVNQIGNEGAEHIAKLQNLVSLNLAVNDISYKGAEHIAKLKDLVSLDLAGDKICDKGAEHLATLQNLVSLNLRHNQIGNEGAKDIATLPNLVSLDLRSNDISDAVLQPIMAKVEDAAKGITDVAGHIQSIIDRAVSAMVEKITGNDIGEEGARTIAQISTLTPLNLYTGRAPTDLSERGATFTYQFGKGIVS